ncbi:MAG: hypothetical protein ACRDRX_28200 [Pseudonocardiaceae bacterium]
MSGLGVEIEAVCEVHSGSGRLVIRHEGDRIVLDGYADHCCALSLPESAATLLFDVLGEWCAPILREGSRG